MVTLEEKQLFRRLWFNHSLQLVHDAKFETKLAIVEKRILKKIRKEDSESFKKCLRTTLTNLLFAKQHFNNKKRTIVAYTTLKEHISKASYGANTFRKIIKTLTEQGYIEHLKGFRIRETPHLPQKSSPSFIYFSKKFNRTFIPETISSLSFQVETSNSTTQPQFIKINDRNGNTLDGDPYTNEWHNHDIAQINNINLKHSVMLGKTKIMVGQLVRVFNSPDYDLGGRLYGDEYQLLPKEQRKKLTIDNEPTVEIDFPSLHPSLILTSMGLKRDNDSYKYPTLHLAVKFGRFSQWRRVVKRAVLIALNAKSRQATAYALTKWLSRESLSPPAASNQILKCICDASPELASKFFCDMGIQLQNQDASIANEIMMALTDDIVRQPYPILGIHDSFIVKESHKSHLLEHMNHILSELDAQTRETEDQYVQRKKASIPKKVISEITRLEPLITDKEIVAIVDDTDIDDLLDTLEI